MNTQSTLMRTLFSPFILWFALLCGGLFYMISFDKKMISEAQLETSTTARLSKYLSALKIRGVNKGIDLAGGTYLVLGIEVEKALEKRLFTENKSLESLFKSKKLAVLPKTREVKNLTIQMNFDDEAAAKACFNLVQEGRASTLKVTRAGAAVSAILMPEVESTIRSGAVEQAVNVLTNRLGGYGVEGIVVQQHGDKKVVVQMPGVDDPERIKSVITKTAHLEFKLVEDTAATYQALLDKFDGEIPADKMIIPGRQEEGEPQRFYLVSSFADMSGEHLVDARVTFDEFNKPLVSFKLDVVGAREFGELTGNNVGRQLGIIIDDMMFSNPVISTPITGGEGVITKIQTQKEALDLSIVLKSGSLVAPLKFEQETRVGASLGQDAINKGITSCLIAFLLLFIFSLFYYKIPGLLAFLILLYNMFLILLFLSYFNATLTLPGIAGMVVTIGMAIDASILIYEQIKEQLAEGVTFRSALDRGFKGAMSVILDSNITTFLTGLVLYQFGGPAIKGFAVTLMLGIVATILSGVYVLKALFAFLHDVIKIKSFRF